MEEILKSFKEGKRDFADFWINYNGKFILIKFIAIRDQNLEYLGTVEVTMDISGLRNLKGEKRLLDKKDFS